MCFFFKTSNNFNFNIRYKFKPGNNFQTIKMKNTKRINSSEIKGSDSDPTALCHDEDDCVTPKDRKILSKPVDVIEIDQNKDQNDDQIELLNENQTEDQIDTSIISQGKILSGKLQLYCKSALNKSLDSIGIITYKLIFFLIFFH